MNQKRNSYVASMCKSTDEADPLRAVAKYVDRYRKPGLTLENLARTLGVSAVVEEKLPFDGGVFSDGTKLTIKINSSSLPTRRKFTLAHELAHLIISQGNAQSARRCLRSTPLEQACDCVAAELLMPIDEALGSIEGHASMGALLSFADKFKVSLYAATVRIKELKVWKESIGLWRWNGSATQLWYVGKSFGIGHKLPSEVCERAMRSTSVVKTHVYGSDSSGIHPVYLKVQKLGREYIVGLIRA